MSQNAVSTLSRDDYQLIEAYHLSVPLATSRIKLGYIHLLRWLCLLSFLLGVIILTIAGIGLGVTDSRNSLSLVYVPLGFICIIMPHF